MFFKDKEKDKQLKPKSFNDFGELLTLEELSQVLKVEPHWIYSKTRTKGIPYIKLGKYLRFRKAEIQEWLSDISVATR